MCDCGIRCMIHFLLLPVCCIYHTHTHTHTQRTHTHTHTHTHMPPPPHHHTHTHTIRGTVLPSQCDNAAEAVPSTPHLCITNLCPTRCSNTNTIKDTPTSKTLYCARPYMNNNVILYIIVSCINVFH